MTVHCECNYFRPALGNVFFGANVGIGVAPFYKLHVGGVDAAVAIENTQNGQRFRLGNAVLSTGSYPGIGLIQDGAATYSWYVAGGGAPVPGAVGISTITPGAPLQVGDDQTANGLAKIGQIRLGTTNGSTFQRLWDLGVTYQGPEAYDFAIHNLTENRTRLLIEYDTGYVGVGTASPTGPMQVGDNVADGLPKLGLIRLGTTNGTASGGHRLWEMGATYLEGGNFVLRDLYRSVPTVLTVQAHTGNVGIGTPTPTAALDVAGQVYARGVATQNDTVRLFANDTAHAGLSLWHPTAALPSGVLFTAVTDSQTRLKSLGRLSFHTGSTDYTADKERLTIAESGNVGIGSTAPNGTLEVASAGGQRETITMIANPTDGIGSIALKASGATTPSMRLFADTTSSNTRLKSFGPLAFHTGSTDISAANERLTIAQNGNVGIAAPGAVARLAVGGLAGQPETITMIADNQIGALTLRKPDGARTWTLFADTATGYTRLKSSAQLALHAGNVAYDGTGQHLTILQSGNVGIGVDVPSQRLEVGGIVQARGGFTTGVEGGPNNGSGLVRGSLEVRENIVGVLDALITQTVQGATFKAKYQGAERIIADVNGCRYA